MEELNLYQQLQQLDEGLTKLEDMLWESKNISKKQPEPQTIYAGTEDNVEFFKQITEAFGISEKLYVIDMVDGEYEIIVK